MSENQDAALFIGDVVYESGNYKLLAVKEGFMVKWKNDSETKGFERFQKWEVYRLDECFKKIEAQLEDAHNLIVKYMDDGYDWELFQTYVDKYEEKQH